MARGRRPHERYRRVVAEHGGAIVRLARAVEADDGRRDELIQEIHLQLWRSLTGFDERCTLRTWVLRVAHNVAASHIDRERRRSRPTVPLHDVEPPDPACLQEDLERRHLLAKISRLARQLPDLDRQVLLLYLEGLSAAEIGEVVGVSANAVSVRVHRLKHRLIAHLGQADDPRSTADLSTVGAPDPEEVPGG